MIILVDFTGCLVDVFFFRLNDVFSCLLEYGLILKTLFDEAHLNF